MNIVNDDTVFTGRVIMAKETGDNGDPNYGNFANKTGDSRINFKVADGIDDQDAVSLKQLKAVKDLAFDFIGETEPTDVVEGDVWLDTSFKGRATVRVRKLTASGAVWVSSIDNISEDLKAEIQALEAKVDKIFASSDGKYALKEGSIDNTFNVAKAINPFNAVNLSQLNDVNSSLVNKIADVDNTKADKTDVYDRNTILSLIEALVPKDSIVGPFNIKGKLTNAELQVLPDPASGDIYYVTDENTWAVRLGNEWFKDRNLLNDGKYFTKQQIIALVEDKASKSDLQAVNQEIEQIKQQIGTIDEAEVNRLIQAAIVNMVKTDGGQTFTKAVKYDDRVTIDDSTDGKTLVHKEYVDKVVAGSGSGVSPSNTYTRQEIDVMLKNYALIDETVTDAELNNTLKNLFRNRNDLNWKGYKNSLPEIEAVLNPEVGDIYGIVSVTKTTPIYMYDGYKWMALSHEEFSKGSTIVIDNPSLENSDTPDKGKKMLKIPMPADSVVQVLGVYVNNADNSSLDEVPVDTIIKNDNLVIYINADDISKIIYITDKGDNNLIDMRAVAKLHRDNIFAENNTFNKNVTILEDATEDTHAL
ncbi:hypothetical protein HXS04_000207, partial [Campylobacter coli]|nr:hypothetical protein [Campylobacter coli]